MPLVARDPLEQRQSAPTIPEDPNDPPRFGQLIETAHDALVLELRRFFDTRNITVERRAEAPTVEKYEFGFGAGLDPYETFTRVVGEHPDVLERLPHVAVTSTTGTNKRMTAGRPFIGHVQAPPRVVGTVAGPYAFAESVPEVTQLVVAVLPTSSPQTYTVTLEDFTASVTLSPGASAYDVTRALAQVIRANSTLGSLFRVTAPSPPQSAPSAPAGPPVVLLSARQAGVSYAWTASANLTLSIAQPAGTATGPDVLVFETTFGGAVTKMSTVAFLANRFATADPVTSASATAAARVFNEQALWAQANVVPVGAGQGLMLIPVVLGEGGGTPSSIEVLAGSSPGVVRTLGLGDLGNTQAGDSISGTAPNMVLNLAAAPFRTVMQGRNLTLNGCPTESNDGRFTILDASNPLAVVYANPYGMAEALTTDAAWFVGARDDWMNPARPPMNRYHQAMMLGMTVDILAEDSNQRREVLDLVLSFAEFYAEIKHFAFYGRGVFDEAYPQEHYQISLGQDVQAAGGQEFQRPGGDAKTPVFVARVQIPLTISHYLDREVLIPFGPAAGQPYVLTADRVQEASNLVRKN